MTVLHSAHIVREKRNAFFVLVAAMLLCGAVDSKWVNREIGHFLRDLTSLRPLFVVYFDYWDPSDESHNYTPAARLKAIFGRYGPDDTRLFLEKLSWDPRTCFILERENPASATSVGRAADQIIRCYSRNEFYRLPPHSQVLLARDDRLRLGCLVVLLSVLSYVAFRYWL